MQAKCKFLVFFLVLAVLVSGVAWSVSAERRPLNQASCEGITEIPCAEYEALVALYEATGGATWANNSGWLQTTTPCSWNGVVCTSAGPYPPPPPAGARKSLATAELRHVIEINLPNNRVTGDLPAEIAALTYLQTLDLSGNQITALPTEIGTLPRLQWLNASQNALTELPAGLGDLASLRHLDLSGNRLEGAIPAPVLALTRLRYLSLASNALSGEVPSSLTALTSLWSADLSYNALTVRIPAVAAFLSQKDPDWAQTQTVPPTVLRAELASPTSIRLTWTQIPYSWDGGYCRISYSTQPGGPYTVHGQTSSKAEGSYLVENLTPGQPYYFVIQSYTPAHGIQQNDLWSARSREVSPYALQIIQLMLIFKGGASTP